VLAPRAVGRHLGDQRPGRRYVGTDRKADDYVTGQEHPRRGGEDNEQQPERIEQHVPLIDLLAAQPVAEPPPDDRADARGDRIGADRPDEADER